MSQEHIEMKNDFKSHMPINVLSKNHSMRLEVVYHGFVTLIQVIVLDQDVFRV